MANRTDPRAHQVHGTNPQFLIDKIIRLKIHNDPYYKEKCFALTAETLVDRAIELKYVGGTYGGVRRPSKFLCLILKMLQIQPDTDIILEFIKNEDYKYIRALGAFYWRLTAQGKDVYKVLEPLYKDYRRIAFRKEEGRFEVMHIDEYIDHLIRDEIFCEVQLPRINKRYVFEEDGLLEPRISTLSLQAQDQEIEEEEEENVQEPKIDENRMYLEEMKAKEKQYQGSSRDKTNEDKGRSGININRGNFSPYRSSSGSKSRSNSKDKIKEQQKDKRRSPSSSKEKDRKNRKYDDKSRKSGKRQGICNSKDKQEYLISLYHPKQRYSSSSSSERYRRDRKRDEKDKYKQENDKYKKSNTTQPKNNDGKQLDTTSDEYWLEMRKKMGLK